MARRENVMGEITTFKLLMQDLPGCVYWKNKDGVYLGCNKYFLSMTGLSTVDKLIGKTDYDLCWGQQADALREHDEKAMLTGRLQLEETVTLSTGEKLTFTVVKSPLHDEQDNVIGVIGTSLDITQQKKFMDALKLAKEKAELANQLKSDFIENMQHDMRTPLAGLCGLLDMLTQEKMPEATSALLSTANQSAKELLALCNDVLDFDNTDNGRTLPILSVVNLRKVASHVVELNQATAKHKGIQLSLAMDDSLPQYVTSDAYRLKKIFTNLVSNALKFTETGEIKLTITVDDADENEVEVRFEVSDTGIGIPEDKKHLIFEKFTRLQASNAGIYKGSGLGLSYVKRFVQDLGGDIEVKSRLGVGTTFCLTLPFVVTPSELATDTSVQDAVLEQDNPEFFAPTENKIVSSCDFSSQNSPEQAHHHTILLIEDDVLARVVAKNAFEKRGYRIITAENVMMAKKTLAQTQFDLVCSDIGLPDGNGFDIVRFVKANPSSLNYATPFVALTAHSGEAKNAQAKEAGFLALLEKPLNREMLNHLINTYLSSQDAKGQMITDTVIDLDATFKLMGDNQTVVLDMLSLLAENLQQEKLALEAAYRTHDHLKTRKLLHKMMGGLSYCGVPRLQKITAILQDEVKKTDQLSSIESIYCELYREIDCFVEELAKIKKQTYC